ncbi:hypothetical protein GCM10008171_19490 [Methylopila jiangsuensis]|uniref:Uncharacterized protein n=1 Tax=Methylopila jiangsuensis TaxID=586230 RepID=A0A9W6JFL1_9HYPH|nr:hypothetical protein [Methylopila jiangsuensis]MDR6286955.1 hypothetical protein [Methylopila jiangsuensis]GLK76695.1 hypothetical protein GCM10008171_19490 [Methylopila jiangsuensis]
MVDPLFSPSLKWLADHWHKAAASGAEAATLLAIKPNTLKTRVSRGQALALRTPAGDVRSNVTYTGYHLVYNLLQDRFARFNVFSPDKSEGMKDLVHLYAEWTREHILGGEHHHSAIIRFTYDHDGHINNHLITDGKIDEADGDTSVIVPIGVMVGRIAMNLWLKSAPDEVSALMTQLRQAANT